MRRENEISEEDRARVAKVTTTGIHAVERKPFRPFYMMLMLTLVTVILTVVAIVIERIYIP